MVVDHCSFFVNECHGPKKQMVIFLNIFVYMLIGRWLLFRGLQRGSRALVKWVNIG